MSAPNDKSSKTVRPQDTPEAEAQSGQTSPRGVLIVRPPNDSENPKERRRRKTPWWEIVAVVIAFGLLIANWFQGCQTKKAAEAANSAAQTASNQFGLAKRHAEDTDEAVGHVGQSVEMNGRTETIEVANVGKATARDARFHIEISENSFPDNKVLHSLATLDVNEPEIVHAQVITKYVAIPAIDWQDIKERRGALVISGTMRYENGFDRIIEKPFCEAILVQPGREGIPNMMPPQPPSLISIPCDSFPIFFKNWGGHHK